MPLNIPKNLKIAAQRIFLLTTAIVLVFMLGMSLLNAFIGNSNDSNVKATNENSFQNTQNAVLGKTAIALTTNLGTRFKERNEIPVSIYSDVLSISQLMGSSGETKAGSGFIAQNMVLTQEYKNVLRTDIKGLLAQSKDKAQILESIIGQLEYRYNLAIEQMRVLLNQRTLLEKELSNTNTQTKNLKSKITSDFQKNDSVASYENIEKYIEIKDRENYAKTYIIYTNQFLADYSVLNEYNKRLLDTLINNKTAIIKEAYVVIPDTGVEFLRDFNLLYDEKDYKAGQKEN